MAEKNELVVMTENKNKVIQNMMKQEEVIIKAHYASGKTIVPASFEGKNVNVYYGDNKVIDDVSLQIDEKSVTAFIGPSGCGKSTF